MPIMFLLLSLLLKPIGPTTPPSCGRSICVDFGPRGNEPIRGGRRP